MDCTITVALLICLFVFTNAIGSFSLEAAVWSLYILPLTFLDIYNTPPQTVFVGGYTVFTSVRPSEQTNESVSVTFCFLNILMSY